MWDVYELKVRLIIRGRDRVASNVSVEIPPQGQGTGMHGEVREAIEDDIEEKWREALDMLGAESESGWVLERILGYAEDNFDRLLRLVPELVVVEMGWDPNANREARRWNVQSEPIEEKEIELTEEQKIKNELRRVRRERKAEEERERIEHENEEKRRRAEDGLEDAKPQVRQEKKLTRKERAGKRSAKTGSRRTKYDPNAPHNQDK
jgi:hypothetical protein